ncbi:gamma-glutamyl-gamma-aminobutyrate hydrolase family protein [Streptomyces hokutonensis]|uniref:gamma-glutamyl-gamma-aminobutyrate hydrolase family protein n=1 Tax=Streptomyces hokutonensis TaxID=1306990 RepID=UPI00381B0389
MSDYHNNPIPRIALTSWLRGVETPAVGRHLLVTAGADYVGRVQQAGGAAVVLPEAEPSHAEAVLHGVHGLVLIGGRDLSPTSYGRTPDGRSEDVSASADAFDLAVCREALARGIPVLAICRGMQVLNVALGGTLSEDVADQTSLRHRVEGGTPEQVLGFRHTVSAVEGSVLDKLYGRRFEVNSIHHQCLLDVAPALAVTARSDDGVVEGVQSAGGQPPLAVGVQWHPEKLGAGASLFDWLIGAAYARVGTVDDWSPAS